MKYEGSLYGRIGKHYFPLEATTDTVKIERQKAEREAFEAGFRIAVRDHTFDVDDAPAVYNQWKGKPK